MLWGALFNQSPMARGQYSINLGHGCPWITNDIRWYITYEVVVQIIKDWDRICAFLKLYKISHDSKAVQNLITVFEGMI